MRRRLIRGIGFTFAWIIGGGIVLAIGFAQCVWPFIRDNTETWTCVDEEIADFCNDPYTLVGFLAEVCGRNQLTITATYIETIRIGSAGPREPGEFEFKADCRGRELKWAAEEGDEIETLDDFRDAAQNDSMRLAVELLEDWRDGLIDYGDARRELLAED